jgi:hypothetical protein
MEELCPVAAPFHDQDVHGVAVGVQIEADYPGCPVSGVLLGPTIPGRQERNNERERAARYDRRQPARSA